MVSKEIVHSGERTCPAQALSPPATGSGLLSSGDIYLVLLSSVVVASRNQVIQNALRNLWEIVPAPATALPDPGELHALWPSVLEVFVIQKIQELPQGQTGEMLV